MSTKVVAWAYTVSRVEAHGVMVYFNNADPGLIASPKEPPVLPRISETTGTRAPSAPALSV